MDRLKNLPVDEIKIDKRFIDGLPKDVSSIGIIRAIIALAEIFDLELVAEGVETGEQLEFSSSGLSGHSGLLFLSAAFGGSD